MDNNRWRAFLGGLLLGVLVTLGLVGPIGWSKYQQMRARAEEAEAELEALRTPVTRGLEAAAVQALWERELKLSAERMARWKRHEAEVEAMLRKLRGEHKGEP